MLISYVIYRPDGRVDFRVPVPKEPMSWLVGAISMSRETGFWFTTIPTRVKFLYIIKYWYS